MEYQKIINLLDNTPNQVSKFKTKIGSKRMVNYEEPIMKITRLDLKLEC